mgnify:CR=1 FL=1
MYSVSSVKSGVNVYGYFSPDVNWYIHYGYNSFLTNYGFDYHYNELSVLRGVLDVYGELFPYIPGIGFFINIGFSFFSLLNGRLYYALRNNKKL